MLPDLRSEAGFDALREAGYPFNFFDSPRQFKMQAELLALAVETARALTAEPLLVHNLAYLLLDSLLAPPPGFEFFPRFPKEEVVQFTKLAVASRENNLPLPIVCPVCPDYRGHYQVADGISRTAGLVLDNLETIKKFFSVRGMAIFIEMHLADVEAYEPLVLQASGESRESFLKKTNGSIGRIQAKIEELGLGETMRAESMSAALSRSGADYFSLKQINLGQISTSDSRKIRRATAALAAERQKLGDFDRLNPVDHQLMAVEELADYAAYGDCVNGRAVILSPDALSAVPAYNFLRGGQKLYNPTIHLKNVKIAHDNFY